MATGTLIHHTALDPMRWYLTDRTITTPAGYDMVLAGPFDSLDEVKATKAALGIKHRLVAVMSCEVPSHGC